MVQVKGRYAKSRVGQGGGAEVRAATQRGARLATGSPEGPRQPQGVVALRPREESVLGPPSPPNLRSRKAEEGIPRWSSG